MAIPARVMIEDFRPGTRPRLYIEGPSIGSNYRCDREQRARRAILSALALFVASQGLLGLMIARPKSSLPDIEFAQKLDRRRRRTGPAAGNPLTVLVLGSSRLDYGLRAQQTEAMLRNKLGRPVVVIHAARSGSGFLTQFFLWRRLHSIGFRPDLTIVEVHPGSLQDGIGLPIYELSESRWPTTRLTWTDLPFVESHAHPLRCGLRREWLFLSAVPLHKARLAILSYAAPFLVPSEFQEKHRDCDASAQCEKLQDEPTCQMRKQNVDYVRSVCEKNLRTYIPGGTGLVVAKELLNSIRDAHTSSMLVVTPEGPEFRSWYRSGSSQLIAACVAGLAADYGIPWVNAREWMQEEDFLDSHHLTSEGARQFTDRFVRENLLPWLQAELDSRQCRLIPASTSPGRN